MGGGVVGANNPLFQTKYSNNLFCMCIHIIVKEKTISDFYEN
jgi:hypothetical protein